MLSIKIWHRVGGPRKAKRLHIASIGLISESLCRFGRWLSRWVSSRPVKQDSSNCHRDMNPSVVAKCGFSIFLFLKVNMIQAGVHMTSLHHYR